MSPPHVDAIVFDVFGTVVDWRSGVMRVGERIDETVDWATIADDWRAEYGPSLERVRSDERAWRNLDVLHRESLGRILDERDLAGLDESDRDQLVGAWHRLDPWPDVLPGLHRLRAEFLIAPLSNGHVRLLTDMAKRAGIPWDLILSAELAGQYKPDEAVYLTAAELLGLPPGAVLMVAAHEGDLDASRAAGLQTAYVHRPFEWGPDAATDAERPAAEAYDLVADDFLELAGRLEAPSLI